MKVETIKKNVAQLGDLGIVAEVCSFPDIAFDGVFFAL
jgi:hypothetical protein